MLDLQGCLPDNTVTPVAWTCPFQHGFKGERSDGSVRVQEGFWKRTVANGYNNHPFMKIWSLVIGGQRVSRDSSRDAARLASGPHHECWELVQRQ